MRRLLAIANPAAGGDAPALAAEAAEVAATAGGWEVGLVLSETRGHAVLLAEEAAATGVDLVLAIGGDGTVREVAAGLAGSEVALGIVPAGTGHSSYMELFGDADWRETLSAGLATPGSRQVDLLRVEPTGELSLLGFSVGWFAQVVELARDDTESEVEGRARYATAAQRAAAAPRSFAAEVELDGEPFASGDLGLAAVGGARRRGGVFPIFPESRMDDGLLELMTVRACTPEEFSDLLGMVIQGRQAESPLVRTGRGRQVRIRSGMPLPVEIDGDLWERDIGGCEVEVAPAALRVMSARRAG